MNMVPVDPLSTKLALPGTTLGTNGLQVLQLVLFDVRNGRVQRIGANIRVYLRNKVLWVHMDELHWVYRQLQAEFVTDGGRRFEPLAGCANMHSFNHRLAHLSRPS